MVERTGKTGYNIILSKEGRRNVEKILRTVENLSHLQEGRDT